MSRIPPWRSVVVAPAGLTAACSLLIDTDGLTGGVERLDAGGLPDVVAPGTPDASADADASAPSRVTDGLVAFYCRALSETEVRRNREIGPTP